MKHRIFILIKSLLIA